MLELEVHPWADDAHYEPDDRQASASEHKAGGGCSHGDPDVEQEPLGGGQRGPGPGESLGDARLQVSRDHLVCQRDRRTLEVRAAARAALAAALFAEVGIDAAVRG